METHYSVLVGRIAETLCGDPARDAGHFAKGAHTATARIDERRNCAATSNWRSTDSRLLFVNRLRAIAVASGREHPALGQISYRAIYRFRAQSRTQQSSENSVDVAPNARPLLVEAHQLTNS